MKGLEQISELTRNISARDRASWIGLYYSIDTDTVSADNKNGGVFVTNLINYNTPQDIQDTIKFWINT